MTSSVSSSSWRNNIDNSVISIILNQHMMNEANVASVSPSSTTTRSQNNSTTW